jgi:hypothetical protein
MGAHLTDHRDLAADAEPQLGERPRVDVVVERERAAIARAQLGAEVDRPVDVEAHRVEPVAIGRIGQPDEADADRGGKRASG